MQQLVISRVLANDEIASSVIRFDLVEVMNFDTARNRKAEGSFGNQ